MPDVSMQRSRLLAVEAAPVRRASVMALNRMIFMV
jgi:hypothetical protein